MYQPTDFYNALPKHKIELIDNKVYIGGSLEKTAMAMAFIIKAYGAEYVADLIPSALIADALIDVYGKKQNQRKADFEKVDSSIPYHRLAADIRMRFFQEESLFSLGPDFVMKLGEDAWTPDIMVIKRTNLGRITPYYLNGPADLIIEVAVPFMKKFDNSTRFKAYADGGVPEVWLVDIDMQVLNIYVLKNGTYEEVNLLGDHYVSRSISNLHLKPSLLFRDEDKAIQFVVAKDSPEGKQRMGAKHHEYGSLFFEPRFDLGPVPIQFKEFIAWAGESKFDFVEDKPVFGGNERTTKEFLALFMMSLGVREVVKYLPAEEWSNLL